MNTYNLKKMCAVSVASIMCVSALAFSGCGDKKAEVSQTPDETTPATTAVSTADEPTAQNYLESIGIDTQSFPHRHQWLLKSHEDDGLLLRI